MKTINQLTIEAIQSLYPNAVTICKESRGWVSLDSDAQELETSQAEIDAEITRLQAEYEAQEYARNRKAKYDALNQFELISDDSINGTTTHKDAILAIKAKYPKPE